MISCLRTGPFGVNTYIVPLDGQEALVIDPAACTFCGDEHVIVRWLAEHSLVPAAFILTHGHFDHVAGLPALKEAFPAAPVCIHADDAACLGARGAAVQKESLTAIGFSEFIPAVSSLPEADVLLSGGKSLADCMGSSRADLAAWQVLHTPGHTAGSCCLYNGPGGSEHSIRESLRTLYTTLPPDTKVYPGHETYGFTIGENSI